MFTTFLPSNAKDAREELFQFPRKKRNKFWECHKFNKHFCLCFKKDRHFPLLNLVFFPLIFKMGI